jgi:hypothetical protein
MTLLSRAAELMQRAWSRPCWAFTPELLAEYVARPDADPELLIPLERDGALTGFFAGVPTTFTHAGARHRTIFTTFLTVDAERAGPAAALQLVRELLSRARARGFTHAVTVFFEGTGSVPAVRRMFELCRAPMQTLLPFRFWIGAPPLVVPRLPPPDRLAELRPFAPADAAACSALFDRLASRIPLLQQYSAADFPCLAQRSAIHVPAGPIDALLLTRVRTTLQARSMRNLHVDLLATALLPPDRQLALLATALRAATATPLDAIVIPDMNQFTIDLSRLGFLRLGPRCEIAAAKLDATAPDLTPVPSALLEVY